jgi:hypothetical protein
MTCRVGVDWHERALDFDELHYEEQGHPKLAALFKKSSQNCRMAQACLALIKVYEENEQAFPR